MQTRELLRPQSVAAVMAEAKVLLLPMVEDPETEVFEGLGGSLAVSPSGSHVVVGGGLPVATVFSNCGAGFDERTVCTDAQEWRCMSFFEEDMVVAGTNEGHIVLHARNGARLGGIESVSRVNGNHCVWLGVACSTTHIAVVAHAAEPVLAVWRLVLDDASQEHRLVLEACTEPSLVSKGPQEHKAETLIQLPDQQLQGLSCDLRFEGPCLVAVGGPVLEVGSWVPWTLSASAPPEQPTRLVFTRPGASDLMHCVVLGTGQYWVLDATFEGDSVPARTCLCAARLVASAARPGDVVTCARQVGNLGGVSWTLLVQAVRCTLVDNRVELKVEAEHARQTFPDATEDLHGGAGCTALSQDGNIAVCHPESAICVVSTSTRSQTAAK